MTFAGIKEAHHFYGFPGSHRVGSIYSPGKGIVRSYSNGKKNDIIKENTVKYIIKDAVHKERFKENIQKKTKLRFFYRDSTGFHDHGMFLPVRIHGEYIIMKRT